MNLPVLAIEHIVQHPEKGAVIAGTHYRVAFLATFIADSEWSVEKIMESYPLTRAQIYAAWSYYYDHQAEIDQQLRDMQEPQYPIGVDASAYFKDRIAGKLPQREKT